MIQYMLVAAASIAVDLILFLIMLHYRKKSPAALPWAIGWGLWALVHIVKLIWINVPSRSLILQTYIYGSLAGLSFSFLYYGLVKTVYLDHHGMGEIWKLFMILSVLGPIAILYSISVFFSLFLTIIVVTQVSFIYVFSIFRKTSPNNRGFYSSLLYYNFIIYTLLNMSYPLLVNTSYEIFGYLFGSLLRLLIAIGFAGLLKEGL